MRFPRPEYPGVAAALALLPVALLALMLLTSSGGAQSTPRTIRSESLKAAAVAPRPAQHWVFCGELANASASSLGPLLLAVEGAATHVDDTAAGAGCDAVGEPTIAAADEELSNTVPVNFAGMYCDLVGFTTTAPTTFTLMDDTVASAIACTVAIGGTECATPVRHYAEAASKMGVTAVNLTDNLSGATVGGRCHLYAAWAP